MKNNLKNIVTICLVAMFSILFNFAYADDEIVAKVGEEDFTTIDEAFSYANKNGGTIVLMQDVSYGDSTSSTAKAVASKASAAIDLNGKTLTILNRGLALTNPDTTFTVEDSVGGGTIDGLSSGVANKQLFVVSKGKLIINGGIIKSNAYAFVVYDGQELELNGGEIYGKSYGAYLMGASKVTVGGAKVVGSTYAGVFLAANGTLDFKSGEIYSENNYSINLKAASTVNITGGKVTGNFGIYVTDGATVNVSGGELISKKYAVIFDKNGKFNMSDGVISSTHGIFFKGENEANLTGGKIFGTNDAIYINGGTVNISGAEVRSDITPVYLHNITEGLSTKLFVTDGIIEKVDDKSAVVLRLESSLEEAACEATISGGKIFGGIFAFNEKDEENEVKLIIKENAEIYSESFAISTNGTGLGNVNITVEGGKVTSDNYAIYFPQPGSINISGGTITGEAGAICLNRGIAKITGGTLISNGTISSDADITQDGTRGYSSATIAIPAEYGAVTVNISGKNTEIIAKGNAEMISDVGTIDAGISKGSTIAISGGTYSAEPDDLVEGVYAYTNEDGTFYVDEVTSFKNVEDTSYTIILNDTKNIELDLELENEELSKYVTAKSSDEKIATVENGIVTLLKPGKVTITLSIGDGEEGRAKKVSIAASKIVSSSEEEEDLVSSVASMIIEDLLNEDETTLTDEEKDLIYEALSEGKVIKVEVVITETNENSITEEELESIDSIMGENAKVSSYLDITVVLKSEEESITNISNLNNEVEVTIDVPNDIPALENKYSRTFKVIRIHNGDVKALDTVDNNNGTVTFKSSLFSTYILTYTDTLIVADNNDGSNDNQNNSDSDSNNQGQQENSSQNGNENTQNNNQNENNNDENQSSTFNKNENDKQENITSDKDNTEKKDDTSTNSTEKNSVLEGTINSSSNNNSINNVNTGDSIIYAFIILGVAVIGIIFLKKFKMK
ncbi:MAG: hypothetical protein IJ809_00020 [Clostridia bacterium]|nr:hypothetical protein [Clostridia bacterium]